MKLQISSREVLDGLLCDACTLRKIHEKEEHKRSERTSAKRKPEQLLP
ncbi:MAG: hypothetical protein QXF04_02610 [Candidatus Aenigmatarchaeota archaeon]